MEGILGTIAEQLPMAVLIFIVIIWLLRREDALDKAKEEAREKERQFQCMEAEKQRQWNEEQGVKREQFQNDLIKHTNSFIKGLQEDQRMSINLLNESIQLVASKTDLVLQSLNHHHSFTEKSVTEISKWKDGIAIRRKAGLED
jgi:DNA-directed RNA polymerase alpha subunit